MKHVVLGTKVLVRAEVASRTAHLFPNNSMSRPANGHQGHVEDLRSRGVCAQISARPVKQSLELGLSPALISATFNSFAMVGR